MEVVERHKVLLEQSHQQAQVDAVVELRVQVGHLQVDLVELFVCERHQRLRQIGGRRDGQHCIVTDQADKVSIVTDQAVRLLVAESQYNFWYQRDKKN